MNIGILNSFVSQIHKNINIKNVEKIDNTNGSVSTGEYSTEIGVISGFVSEVSKDINANSAGKSKDASNFSFKDIIDRAKAQFSDNGTENINKDSSNENSILNRLKGLTENLEQGLESGNEDEVIEQVMCILNLLNINIVERESLPIIVDFSEDNVLFSNEVKLADYSHLDNSINTGEELLSDFSKEITNLLNDNEIPAASEETIKNVSKLVDLVQPLVKDISGNDIDKNDIIEALKNKLEVTNLEEIDKTMLSSKVINLKDISTNLSDDKDGNTEGNLGNLNFMPLDTEEISEEDKVLNKALGLGEVDKFSQVMNRLNSRNEIQAEKIVSANAVFKETMDEDIIKNVKFMLRNQVQELKVKIYPKELGEMTIKILSEEGIMRAEISAISKETYNLLNSNINEIKKSLSNENIKIQEVNIGIYNEDTTYFSGQGYKEDAYNSKEKHVSNISNRDIEDYEEPVEEVINNSNSNVDLLV